MSRCPKLEGNLKDFRKFWYFLLFETKWNALSLFWPKFVHYWYYIDREIFHQKISDFERASVRHLTFIEHSLTIKKIIKTNVHTIECHFHHVIQKYDWNILIDAFFHLELAISWITCGVWLKFRSASMQNFINPTVIN